MSRVKDFIDRIRGKAKGNIETSITSRNINDVTISVKEGLSDTREIQITSWNPALASALFWEIRGGLRDPMKANIYESVGLITARKTLAGYREEQKKHEEMS